jgi:hypothetical protein
MIDTYHALTDIEWYLLNWARYMRSGCSPMKLPKASAGLECYSSSPDTDTAYDAADLTAAEATDAAIADLEPIESCAIHHTYLGAVYRFHRYNIDFILDLASRNVQASLIRRGIFVERVVDTN